MKKKKTKKRYHYSSKEVHSKRVDDRLKDIANIPRRPEPFGNKQRIDDFFRKKFRRKKKPQVKDDDNPYTKTKTKKN